MAETKAPEDGATPVRLLKLADAARAMGVSPKWIRSRRHLPFFRELSPRVLRVDGDAMKRWLERRRP